MESLKPWTKGLVSQELSHYKTQRHSWEGFGIWEKWWVKKSNYFGLHFEHLTFVRVANRFLLRKEEKRVLVFYVNSKVSLVACSPSNKSSPAFHLSFILSWDSRHSGGDTFSISLLGGYGFILPQTQPVRTAGPDNHWTLPLFCDDGLLDLLWRCFSFPGRPSTAADEACLGNDTYTYTLSATGSWWQSAPMTIAKSDGNQSWWRLRR